MRVIMHREVRVCARLIAGIFRISIIGIPNTFQQLTGNHGILNARVVRGVIHRLHGVFDLVASIIKCGICRRVRPLRPRLRVIDELRIRRTGNRLGSIENNILALAQILTVGIHLHANLICLHFIRDGIGQSFSPIFCRRNGHIATRYGLLEFDRVVMLGAFLFDNLHAAGNIYIRSTFSVKPCCRIRFAIPIKTRVFARVFQILVLLSTYHQIRVVIFGALPKAIPLNPDILLLDVFLAVFDLSRVAIRKRAIVFFQGIGDGSFAIVFKNRKARQLRLPVVLRRQGYGFAGINAICQNGNGNGVRTQTCAILIVVPQLAHIQSQRTVLDRRHPRWRGGCAVGIAKVDRRDVIRSITILRNLLIEVKRARKIAFGRNSTRSFVVVELRGVINLRRYLPQPLSGIGKVCRTVELRVHLLHVADKRPGVVAVLHRSPTERVFHGCVTNAKIGVRFILHTVCICGLIAFFRIEDILITAHHILRRPLRSKHLRSMRSAGTDRVARTVNQFTHAIGVVGKHPKLQVFHGCLSGNTHRQIIIRLGIVTARTKRFLEQIVDAIVVGVLVWHIRKRVLPFAVGIRRKGHLAIRDGLSCLSILVLHNDIDGFGAIVGVVAFPVFGDFQVDGFTRCGSIRGRSKKCRIIRKHGFQLIARRNLKLQDIAIGFTKIDIVTHRLLSDHRIIDSIGINPFGNRHRFRHISVSASIQGNGANGEGHGKEHGHQDPQATPKSTREARATMRAMRPAIFRILRLPVSQFDGVSLTPCFLGSTHSKPLNPSAANRMLRTDLQTSTALRH